MPSTSETTLNADVKFDPRDGIYYRSQEEEEAGGDNGFQAIDYGFGKGTSQKPMIAADLDNGEVHNLFAHPRNDGLSTPVLYAVNVESNSAEMDVFDVSDPPNQEILSQAGPQGAIHDFVVDPEQDLGHAAYIFLAGSIETTL